jgi:hypothetical protein
LFLPAVRRRGRYAVSKLVKKHGDAKLTDLLRTLANCPKAQSASIYDPCKLCTKACSCVNALGKQFERGNNGVHDGGIENARPEGFATKTPTAAMPSRYIFAERLPLWRPYT